MIKPVVKDTIFLGQKSEEATRADLAIADDLRDTLAENSEHCVGMVANMIGIRKRIIIANMGMGDIIMFNPVITKKDSPYETEESCFSLIGTRKTTRYKNIEVEYTDLNWNRQKQKYSGFLAQIIQHECDHLEGIII